MDATGELLSCVRIEGKFWQLTLLACVCGEKGGANSGKSLLGAPRSEFPDLFPLAATEISADSARRLSSVASRTKIFVVSEDAVPV